MFTGIIEEVGVLCERATEGSNVHFWVQSALSEDLKVDQSVSHEGVCLTVTALRPGAHRVTAIHETLQRSTLGSWRAGKRLNLERCLPANGRLDGHIVQGHVDIRGTCESRREEGGSWRFGFAYDGSEGITVPKGSIAVNGVSLTVAESSVQAFSVAIIPYTFEHTTFASLRPGEEVNLEFDILGKYVQTLWQRSQSQAKG